MFGFDAQGRPISQPLSEDRAEDEKRRRANDALDRGIRHGDAPYPALDDGEIRWTTGPVPLAYDASAGYGAAPAASPAGDA